MAAKSGLFERFWDLSQTDQAWIVAIYETESLIDQVTAYVMEQENAD